MGWSLALNIVWTSLSSRTGRTIDRRQNNTVKIRNAWQSLAYSPLGTTVLPPSKTNRASSSERAKNACSISFLVLRQHYLVAMATSLNKLENKVPIHHMYVKHFHTVKRLRKSVQYIRRYSTKNGSFWLCRTWCSQMSTVNSEVTGPNFTNFSHDIEASFALLLCSARPWYCNSFSSISAINARGISRRW